MRACTARCTGQTSAMTNSAKAIGAKIDCAALQAPRPPGRRRTGRSGCAFRCRRSSGPAAPFRCMGCAALVRRAAPRKGFGVRRACVRHRAPGTGTPRQAAMQLMVAFTRRLAGRGAALLLGLVALGLGLRIYDVQRGPPLRPLAHRGARGDAAGRSMEAADWARWMAAEAGRSIATVRARGDRRARARGHASPANRYFAGSPMHPPRFAQDWNRSFLLEPAGRAARRRGLPARADRRALQPAPPGRGLSRPRLPRHRPCACPATAPCPAGLTEAVWEDWMAATRLAVREARARGARRGPLHLVGYSNGGALALKHALDALEDPRLPRAERLVLISPMIGRHRLRALRRPRRAAGAAAALRQDRLARHPAGVQPLQVQLLPGQRGAAVLPADRSAAGAGRAAGARPGGSRRCRRC